MTSLTALGADFPKSFSTTYLNWVTLQSKPCWYRTKAGLSCIIADNWDFFQTPGINQCCCTVCFLDQVWETERATIPIRTMKMRRLNLKYIWEHQLKECVLLAKVHFGNPVWFAASVKFTFWNCVLPESILRLKGPAQVKTTIHHACHRDGYYYHIARVV